MAYFIEEGKSLTSKKGILHPHDSVTVNDLGGNESSERLVELHKLGYLYVGECSKPEAKVQAEKAKARAIKDAEAKKASVPTSKSKDKGKN